jgi:hypothetical protein
MSAPMSPEGYAAAGGNSCPVCASDRLSGDRYQAKAVQTITQSVACHACGATWTAVYELTGYEQLDAPQEDTP